MKLDLCPILMNFVIVAASVPFEVTVHFDENEAFTANTDASTYDQGVQPGGITGMLQFSNRFSCIGFGFK